MIMEFTTILKKLIILEPFYGFFLLNINKVQNNNIQTLRVVSSDLNFSLEYNINFWDSLSELEQYAVLKHEILHLVFKHLFNYNECSDKKILNIAQDMEVNQYIDNLPKGCIDYNEFKNNYPEYFVDSKPKDGSLNYYKILIKISNDNKLNDYNTLDDHSSWNKILDKTEETLLTEHLKQIIKNTVETLKKENGSIPGDICNTIEELIKKNKPLFNWKSYFRSLIGHSYDIFTKKILRKESKRFPGSAGIKLFKKQNILIAIDTSGSVSNKELAEFASEIDNIHHAINFSIIQCDTAITNIQKYKHISQLYNIYGRGGTDFDPIFEYYYNNLNNFSKLIIFTDGFAPIPKVRNPKNLIWILTSNHCEQQYPGLTIKIPKRI